MVFADAVKLKISQWLQPGLGWVLNPMKCVLIREGREWDKHKEKEGHVKPEAEIGGKRLETKEHMKAPEAWKMQGILP